MTQQDLDRAIRRVADFPKPGITFYDITSVLSAPDAFSYCVDELTRIVRDSQADALAAIEARGFIFASAVAKALRLPVILARKKGKLPNPCRCQGFSLEYGTDTICIQELDLATPRKVHIIDDLLATGGTARATAQLLESSEQTVCGISAVIGLPFLGYGKLLSPRPVNALIEYDSE